MSEKKWTDPGSEQCRLCEKAMLSRSECELRFALTPDWDRDAAEFWMIPLLFGYCSDACLDLGLAHLATGKPALALVRE